MPFFRGVPLSDDEYDERVLEAETVACFQMAAVFGSSQYILRALDETLEAMVKCGEVCTELLRASLDGLTTDERERYDHLSAMGVLPFDALALLDQSDDAVAAELDAIANEKD